MDKLSLALQIWGALALACSLAAKLLPPGKAQALFAFLGSLAAPKPIDAPKADK